MILCTIFIRNLKENKINVVKNCHQTLSRQITNKIEFSTRNYSLQSRKSEYFTAPIGYDSQKKIQQ